MTNSKMSTSVFKKSTTNSKMSTPVFKKSTMTLFVLTIKSHLTWITAIVISEETGVEVPCFLSAYCISLMHILIAALTSNWSNSILPTKIDSENLFAEKVEDVYRKCPPQMVYFLPAQNDHYFLCVCAREFRSISYYFAMVIEIRDLNSNCSISSACLIDLIICSLWFIIFRSCLLIFLVQKVVPHFLSLWLNQLECSPCVVQMCWVELPAQAYCCQAKILPFSCQEASQLQWSIVFSKPCRRVGWNQKIRRWRNYRTSQEKMH